MCDTSQGVKGRGVKGGMGEREGGMEGGRERGREQTREGGRGRGKEEEGDRNTVVKTELARPSRDTSLHMVIHSHHST